MSIRHARLFLDECPAVLELPPRRGESAVRIAAPDPAADIHAQSLALLDEAQRRRPWGGLPLSACIVFPRDWAQVRRIEGLPEGAHLSMLGRIVSTSPSRFFFGRPSTFAVGPVARDASGAHWCTAFAADELQLVRRECRRRSLTVHCVESARDASAGVSDALRRSMALLTRDPLRVSAAAARAATALALGAGAALFTIPTFAMQRMERHATAEYERLRAEYTREFQELDRASGAAILASLTSGGAGRSSSVIRALASVSDALVAGTAIQAIHIDSASVTLTVIGSELATLVPRLDGRLAGASPQLIGPITGYGDRERGLMRATVRLKQGPWSAMQPEQSGQQ